MDQHPVPRQITTFEFKLIGFLTVKQFIYILVFAGLAGIVYFLTPIPLLNTLFAIIVFLIGVAFAFIPINDRPMEIWIKNLIKKLTSPTQYTFKKENKPPAFLINSNLNSNPQITSTYIDSQQKLKSYLSSKKQNTIKDNKKQTINNLLNNPISFLTQKQSLNQLTSNQQKVNQPSAISNQQSPIANHKPVNQQPATSNPQTPFLSGIIKNYKQTPLAGILIYIKNEKTNEPLRILKSNIHGVFISHNPLPSGDYLLEIKDPKQVYFFDTMKIKINDKNNQPLEIFSKELI